MFEHVMIIGKETEWDVVQIMEIEGAEFRRRREEKREKGVKNPRRRDEYRDAGHTEWNEIYFF